MFVGFDLRYPDLTRRGILDLGDGMDWSALLHCSTVALDFFQYSVMNATTSPLSMFSSTQCSMISLSRLLSMMPPRHRIDRHRITMLRF
jgi:hypothetical protein